MPAPTTRAASTALSPTGPFPNTTKDRGSYLKGVPDRPGARLDTAAQRAEALEVGVVGHSDHVAFVGEGECRERGLPEEVAVDRAAVL